ncbi:MAG: ABC transporter permease [Chloroflexota bacterium]
MTIVGIIYRKELLDTIRDRRTLLVMIVVPLLLMPALIVGLNKLTTSSARATARVAVSGTGYVPQLMALLRADSTLKVVTDGDPAALVRDQKADVGLVVGPAFAARLRASLPAPLTIVSDETQATSSLGAERVRAVLQAYQTRIAFGRLRARGVDPHLLEVVAIGTRNVASQQAMSGLILSFILPVFLVIWAITGGMYTAIDVAAGEKERNTLEALLMTPARKVEITIGKLLAVTSVAFVAMIAAVGSLAYSLQRWPLEGRAAGGPGGAAAASLPAATLAVMLGIGLLLALTFSSLELALSVFARSFKEAQNYITPLYLATLVPVSAINAIPTLRPATGLFLIPVISAVLVFKEALLGRMQLLHLLLSCASLAVFAAASVAAASYVFTRESVLFKT